MSYKAIIEEHNVYLKCIISGDREVNTEVDDITKVWSSLYEICINKGYMKVLAVFKLSGRLSALGSYSIVETAELLGWNRKIKLAIFDTNSESLKDNLFTEDVAFNRGYNVKIFSDENEAKEWLLL